MTTKTSKIVLFQDQKIRRDWNEKEQKWYFSVIDIVKALTELEDDKNEMLDMSIDMVEFDKEYRG